MSTVEENRVRRQAKRLGMMISKSRGKKWNVDNQMGYMIVDGYTNGIVAGSKYELSLDEVEEWLTDYEKQIKK